LADEATPNLPSRDFDRTIAFFSPLGFELSWRDDHWLILERNSATIEFFLFQALDPLTSSFGCCLRLDDADTFYAACLRSGVPEKTSGFPRVQPIRMQAFGLRMGTLLDPDGSLIRIIENE
jgi:catechol 2,3-dioxygenase-like lactoylglutathione lyase family enzyme